MDNTNSSTHSSLSTTDTFTTTSSSSPTTSSSFTIDDITTTIFNVGTTANVNSSNVEITHHNASISGNITLKNFSINAGGGDKVFPNDIYDNTTSPFKETSVGLLATRASFLVIFIFLGFSGNFILVATVTHSRRLQSSILNMLIVSLAIVNLVDTVVNLPIVLGCTITQNWEYGTFACQFNSFMINTMNMLTLFCILNLTLDRLIAVQELSKYKKRMTRCRAILLIFLAWAISLIISIPIIAGAIPSKAFHYRYLCSVAEKASLVYIIAHTTLGVVAPILFIIGLLIKIIYITRQKRHLGDIQAQHSYSNNWSDDPDMWENEVSAARFVGVLFLFWILLEGPYVTLNYIEQYRNSAEINMPGYVLFTYRGEIDLAFTWMRLSFSVVLPFLAFIARKELKIKIKDLVLCRKSNLIIDASPQRMCTQKTFEKSSDGGSLNVSQSTSFKVPVLFATADGLHLQTYTEDEITDSDSESSHNVDLNSPEILNDTRNFRSRKCDVNASQDNLNDDTSDYDSEPEFVLQTSMPVSVKQLNKLSDKVISEVINDLEKSSKTLPENDSNPRLSNLNYEIDTDINGQDSLFRVSEKGDSGIDSVPHTHEKKKKRKKKKSADIEVTKIEEFKPDRNDGKTKKKDSWVYQNGFVEEHVNSNCGVHKSVPNSVEVSIPESSVVAKKKKRKSSKDKKDNQRKRNEIPNLSHETLENSTCPSSHIDGIVLRPPPRLKPLKHKTSTCNSEEYLHEHNNKSVITNSKSEHSNATLKEMFCSVDNSTNPHQSFNSDMRKNSDESQKSLLHHRTKSSNDGHVKEKPRKSSRHRKVDSVDLHLCSSNESTTVIKLETDIFPSKNYSSSSEKENKSRVNTADYNSVHKSDYSQKVNGDIEFDQVVQNKPRKKSKHMNGVNLKASAALNHN
ncbi:uncharacterized protein LOC141900439 [Tubulanus polymorphus]|uniref:uncharacterized protein LOC141900439 n=1 Tax=Tubulanus polymorphus TaxID=672921 RepID=UPI003DA5CB35